MKIKSGHNCPWNRMPKCRVILIAAIILFAVMSLGMASRDTAKTIENRPVWPQPPLKSKVEFVKTIKKPDDIGVKKGFFRKLWSALAGEAKEEQVVKPFGIAVDNKNRLYITDTALMMVHIFDMTNAKYSVIEGPGEGRFSYPVGIDIDAEGNIFVSDSLQKRVYVFSEKGRYLKEITPPERYGEFQRPTGIAINRAEGLLYVVDTVAGIIHVYTTGGEYKFSFGERGEGDGKFNYPTFITVSGNGELYVSDTLNFRIQRFDKNGKFISKFGQQGDGTGDMANPRGLALDSDGNIYMVDSLFEAVQVFDMDGQLLLVIGKSGTNSGEFILPSGIAIDSSDNIYIADSFNGRIQALRYLKPINGGNVKEQSAK